MFLHATYQKGNRQSYLELDSGGESPYYRYRQGKQGKIYKDARKGRPEEQCLSVDAMYGLDFGFGPGRRKGVAGREGSGDGAGSQAD